MSLSSKICITGAGIISALGIGKDETLRALRAQQSGIDFPQILHTTLKNLPVGEVKLTNEQLCERLQISSKGVVRTQLLGAIAVKEALIDAGLQDAAPLRIAFVSGTTVGGMDKTEMFLSGDETETARCLLTHDCGASTQMIAQLFPQLNALETTLSTACSSAANAIIYGARLIESGKYDIVVAGGSESLTRYHFDGFHSLMILDEKRCRPFSDDRSGLNLGEGAAFLVMESAASAQQRGKKVHMLLSGYGNACDAFHQTATSEQGNGAFLAMQKALKMSELAPENIDYVNAHGTGTQNNDATEVAALTRLFGKNVPPVSSTKSYTGHTTSASGSIEAVICLLSLQNQFLPINLGCDKPLTDEIDFIQNEQPKRPLRHVMCNSFGFGGNDSSLIFSLPDADLRVKEKSTASRVFIKDGSLISAQPSLDDGWLNEPKILQEPFTRSIDPNFNELLNPRQSRRWGLLMKRTMFAAQTVMQRQNVQNPDAIITGTGLGCLENSERFLNQILQEGESSLKPTDFMQSTHNTLSSLIAIQTQSHGYNSTFSQRCQSFEAALSDAFMQIRLAELRNALVCGTDEMTPSVFQKLVDAKLISNANVSYSETTCAMLLSNDSANAMCEVEDVGMVGDVNELASLNLHPDAILSSSNGCENQSEYNALASLYPEIPILHYKHLFGENPSASAAGIYIAACCLQRQEVPSYLRQDGGLAFKSQRILSVNIATNKKVAYVLLKSVKL